TLVKGGRAKAVLPPKNPIRRRKFRELTGTGLQIPRQRMVSVDQPLASTSGPFVPLQEPSASRPIEVPPEASAEPAKVSLSFQDQQTLSQLRRGNWAAMEQLVHRYQDRLYVMLLRMVNHPEDAADLVQETFVRAIQNVSRFEGKS